MKSRQISSEEKIVLLGASRGLGWSTYQLLSQTYPQASYLLASRKIQSRENEVTAKTKLTTIDFSKVPVNSDFLKTIEDYNPTRLIYFAAGGPFGAFESKKWSDHLWALNTSFLFPAELLHLVMSSPVFISLRQIVFVGSAIAEDKPDAYAASYAASKHALKGLITSIQKEHQGGENKTEVLLFSPGYMQTDMLPQNSHPRQNGLAENPVDVAKKLVAMLEKSD